MADGPARAEPVSDPAAARRPRDRAPPGPPRLILASASPRRLALLRQIGLDPEVRVADVDETPRAGETPMALVRRLARAKAEALGPPDAGALILAADTVVDLDGRTLGKPPGREAGIAMLLALGGREHRVVTGLCLRRPLGGRVATRTLAVTTRVRFGRVGPGAAARYWDGGEPRDKAGGYAIQGQGARFVAGIVGSYSNVVGLPLHETARLLAAAGLDA